MACGGGGSSVGRECSSSRVGGQAAYSGSDIRHQVRLVEGNRQCLAVVKGQTGQLQLQPCGGLQSNTIQDTAVLGNSV